MAFDKNLDKSLFSEVAEVLSEFGTTRLTISIMSYNEGDKKLQISREKSDTEMNFNFAKLGRLTKQEVDVILPIIKKAREQM